MKNNKQVIFRETVCMETQTVYRESGQIDTYPCDFERGQQIVAGATKVSQRGRMTTDDDGKSTFKPYREGTGKRYKELKKTPHGVLKACKKSLVLHMSLPASWIIERSIEAIQEETGDMCQWLNCAREAILRELVRKELKKRKQ